MSRVDEALGRAAALEKAPTGEAFTTGNEFTPAASADLWPSEEMPAEEEIALRPAVENPVPPHPEPTSVPAFPGLREMDEKLVSRQLDSGCVEQYRRLAARLHLAQAERGIKTVMVSSALPGEGKTLTAANLALTLSHSYKRRVLLIDGDLRRPYLHELFGVPNVSGLNDGVRSAAKRKVPLIRWSENLTVLTAGRPDPDPMSVLSSERMRQIVGEASVAFDWVIIDTPPVGLLSDANLLAAMVDAVILVVQAARTPFYDINKAVQTLGRESIFGVVLNRLPSNGDYPYNQYYYSYASNPVAD